MRIKQLSQRNGQLVMELISYFVSLKMKLKPAPTEAERFRALSTALHIYLQDAFLQRENLMTTQTQLEETALLLKSIVVLPPEIIMKRPGMARRGKASKLKSPPQ